MQYPITLSGKQLQWFSSVKHLGHIFDCCLSFAKDVVGKKGKFVACVNNIVTGFGFAHPRCKAKMVKIYSTIFMAVVYGIYLGQIVKNVLEHGILP